MSYKEGLAASMADETLEEIQRREPEESASHSRSLKISQILSYLRDRWTRFFQGRRMEELSEDSVILKELLAGWEVACCLCFLGIPAQGPYLMGPAHGPSLTEPGLWTRCTGRNPSHIKTWQHQPSREVACSTGPVGLAAHVIFLKLEKPSCLGKDCRQPLWPQAACRAAPDP